jgi:dTDP-4-amino-4,6-dideoxygalactose transaminase
MSLKKNNIKFVDLYRQNKLIEKRIKSIFAKKIENSDFIDGLMVSAFENEFAKFCNKKYAVSLNSGTDALKFALLAYGVKAGDEVITVPNSYFSTASVISEIGAVPVFVDVNPKYYTIDVKKIEENITKKTKAIIPVHLYGQMAEMDKVMNIAHKYKLKVIEDCCHAHGASYHGKRAPYGETGAFSFYPSKNLGCFGDGGAIVTDNKALAEKIKYLRNDGSVKKYYHEYFGFKSRMDEIQAAVLSLKLPYLNTWNSQRRELARYYIKLLKNVNSISLPQEAEKSEHVYHLFVIEIEKRDQLKDYLKKNNVETIIHYPIPIHLQKPYLENNKYNLKFPVTEAMAKKILSLPIYPGLKKEEVKYICNLIHDFME